MIPRRLIPIVAVSLAAMILRLEAQPSQKLLLGAMRRDGVILPFASYDGKWELPWPASILNIELPITLDDVPKKWWGGEMRTAWTLWPPEGREPVRVSTSVPISVLVGMEKRLGLRTNYVSPEAVPAPFELPFPKDGLAVAGDASVQRISGVSKLATAWRDLTTSLKDDIDEAEQKSIDRAKSSSKWAHPIPRPVRQATFAELEAWYTSSLVQPGFGLSYIEAVKKYPAGEEDKGCGLETFVSGWVHTNERQSRPKTDLIARITYCDRDRVSYMLPLGLLLVNNRTHWVFQLSSWDSEWYAVVEATPGRVRYVAEYFGGGRPRPF